MCAFYLMFLMLACAGCALKIFQDSKLVIPLVGKDRDEIEEMRHKTLGEKLENELADKQQLRVDDYVSIVR